MQMQIVRNFLLRSHAEWNYGFVLSDQTIQPAVIERVKSWYCLNVWIMVHISDSP